MKISTMRKFLLVIAWDRFPLTRGLEIRWSNTLRQVNIEPSWATVCTAAHSDSGIPRDSHGIYWFLLRYQHEERVWIRTHYVHVHFRYISCTHVHFMYTSYNVEIEIHIWCTCDVSSFHMHDALRTGNFILLRLFLHDSQLSWLFYSKLTSTCSDHLTACMPISKDLDQNAYHNCCISWICSHHSRVVKVRRS